MGTGSFPGKKLSGIGVNDATLYSAEDKERLEPYFYPFSAFMACSGRILPSHVSHWKMMEKCKVV